MATAAPQRGIDLDRMNRAISAVETEVRQAAQAHAKMNSAHEAYAVLKEEVDEFWDEVKLNAHARSDDKMRRELVQVAAMAVRAIADLEL